MLIEWLKGLLSMSWNQRNTKEKQIVMGLTSIKFRQPIEINSGKKMGEKERGLKIIAYVYQQTSKHKSKSIKYVAFKQRTRNIISSMNTTYYET